MYLADFHIHSHYSLATSRDLTPERLDWWARAKGLEVVGTGDFTHPGWTRELREKLEPAEPDSGACAMPGDSHMRRLA
jgi:PHP family Zn ribbon phosphoesterase